MCVYVCMYVCMYVCEGVVYDSVFLVLDGQNFFEIIALTLAIRWHATCRYLFFVEFDIGYPLGPKNRKLNLFFCR